MVSQKLWRYLTELNEAERIYKQYQLIKNDPEKTRQFSRSLTTQQRKIARFPYETTTADTPPVIFSEADYLGDDYFGVNEKRSIFVWNLFRYAPSVVHSHEFFELMYVLKGQCIHTVEGRENTLQEGSLCLFSPAFTHSVFIDDDDSIVIQCFIRRSTIENTFFELIRRHDILASFLINSLYTDHYANFLLFQTHGSDEIKEQLLELYEEQYIKDEFSGSIVNAMFMTFLLKLVRNYRNTIESPNTSQYDTTITQMYHILLQKYSTITLPELAKELNYSTQYCSNYIKKVTGRTFSQLLRAIRMQKAKQLLSATSMSIAQIGLQVGFEYPESFIRSFTKEVGMTPTEYKVKSSL